MEILEYNEVDPHQVFYINRMALDHALTPERVAMIRQTDPRPFPCLAVYAVEHGAVLGQVGVFRLPMVTTGGREDVGGVWAVSTHPQYCGRGIASLLLDEAHQRMRLAGLRFSTLATNRYRTSYKLYLKHGYEDTRVWGTALAPWEIAHQPTRLHARLPGPEGYDFIEKIWGSLAQGYLGFAWRYTPFARLRWVSLADIWLLYENLRPVGFVFAQVDQTTLMISNIFLQSGIDAAEAMAALAAEIRSTYVQVRISRPSEVASLQRAGYHVAQPDWHAFMIKPLVPEVSLDDARRLFGIGSDHFLISWLDTT